MGCPGCETLPSAELRPGVLYLAPSLGHTRNQLSQALTADFTVEVPAEGVLGVRVAAGDLPALLGAVAAALSAPEQEACRALFLPQGEAFGVAHMLNMERVSVLIGRERGRWLSELMEAERLTCHFHPIVDSADPQRVHAHECLLRGREADGSMVFPDRLFPAARAAELMFHLDRAARLTAIRESHRHALNGKVFINFNPTAIYDPQFCLQSTLREVERAGLSPRQFVFEVVESEEIADAGHLERILRFYRDHGFAVALDDLGAGYGSLGLLERLRPDYVKIDRDLVSGVDRDAYKAKIMSSLIGLSRELGVAMIAEGVETRAEWQWLRQHGVDYCQGFFFARPATPPPAVTVPGVDEVTG